jgi:DNA-binding CsgD family transcriptional regulator
MLRLARANRNDADSDQDALLATLESMSDALELHGSRGGVRRIRVDDVLAGDPRGDQVRAEIRAIVDSMRAAKPSQQRPGTRARAQTRLVVTPLNRYRLRGMVFTPGFGGVTWSIVVAIDQFGSVRSLNELIMRFQFTRREAQAATLLVERRSNAEIARVLGISEHTARHHTERVMRKLGVTSRRDAARVIVEGRPSREE